MYLVYAETLNAEGTNVYVAKYVCSSYQKPVVYKGIKDAIRLTRDGRDFIIMDDNSDAWIFESLGSGVKIPSDFAFDKYLWNRFTQVFESNPDYGNASLRYELSEVLHIANSAKVALVVDGGATIGYDLAVARHITAGQNITAGGTLTVNNSSASAISVTGGINSSSLNVSAKAIVGELVVSTKVAVGSIEVNSTSLFAGVTSITAGVAATAGGNGSLIITGGLFTSDFSYFNTYIGVNGTVISNDGIAINRDKTGSRNSYLSFSNRDNPPSNYSARIIHKSGESYLDFENNISGSFRFNADVFINTNAVIHAGTIADQTVRFASKGLGNSLGYVSCLIGKNSAGKAYIGYKNNLDEWSATTEVDFAIVAYTAQNAQLLGGSPASYFLNAANLAEGIIPVSRLSGSYNINISGTAVNADMAGTAVNAQRLDAKEGAFYLNASNLNDGVLPVARLNGTYNIGITGEAGSVQWNNVVNHPDISGNAIAFALVFG